MRTNTACLSSFLLTSSPLNICCCVKNSLAKINVLWSIVNGTMLGFSQRRRHKSALILSNAIYINDKWGSHERVGLRFMSWAANRVTGSVCLVLPQSAQQDLYQLVTLLHLVLLRYHQPEKKKRHLNFTQ